MSGLIWIQTGCKSYQQVTLVGNPAIFCLEDVDCFLHLLHISEVYFRIDFIMEANTMNHDQTAPLGAV